MTKNDNNQKHENVFKFGLYQNNDPISETIFTADVFNPVIRYSVDIRDDIFSIILRLQKALSKDKGLTKKISFSDKNYNLLEYYKNQVSNETKPFNNKLVSKERSKHRVHGKIYSGVQFKFGLYINDNPIVERDFYVEGYNPETRLSEELNNTVREIAEEINQKLKDEDVSHMWDDYDLINTYNLHINDIRDLSYKRRKLMLRNITDKVFIKNTKRSFRK